MLEARLEVPATDTDVLEESGDRGTPRGRDVLNHRPPVDRQSQAKLGPP